MSIREIPFEKRRVFPFHLLREQPREGGIMDPSNSSLSFPHRMNTQKNGEIRQQKEPRERTSEVNGDNRDRKTAGNILTFREFCPSDSP